MHSHPRLAQLGPCASYPLPSPAQSITSVLDLASALAPDECLPSTACVHGRAGAVRTHGRLAFIDLVGPDGQIQLIVSRDLASDARQLADQIQRGDVIEASGSPARARRGEPSVMVTSLTLLAPALREHVDPHTGLRDIESRRRDRTLDLMTHPAERERLVTRSRVIQAMRGELLAAEYLEMDTPILQAHVTGNAELFATSSRACGQQRSLRTAPEFDLERLVSSGIERVFEFARNFRNESADRTHSPEFTALEWYGAWRTAADQMHLCRRLLTAADAAAGQSVFSGIAEREFADLWCERFHCDPLDERAVRAALGDRPGSHAELLETGWQAIEPQLVEPVFVTAWPQLLAPLARPLDGREALADRWDLYAGGMELGACYQELNDPVMQRQLMSDADQLDEPMLHDMLLGMLPMSGAGLGVDRVVMLLTGAEHIRQVQSFPDYRR